MECHDPNKYRKKIKGFRLAFNIRDKYERIDENDGGRKFKFKHNPSAAEIRQKVSEMKQARLKNNNDRESEKRERYERNRETLKRMHEKMRRERIGAAGPPGEGGGFDGGYLAIKNKQLGLPSGEGKY